jgi:hypothetical protein
MVYPAHYAWLVDFDGPWCTNVNTSAWSDVSWNTLHTMPDLLTLQQVRHSVQGIPSNVTSGNCVYISTSRSIKVNKSGIVCRVYHQTSLQALLFTLIHRGPSKSTSKHKCLKWRFMVYPAHYAWLVDFDGPWCTNVNTSDWSDVWWYTLHTSQQVRHSVQGIPWNVTSGTCVYISTSRSIKVNKSGIVCRVYHMDLDVLM